MAGARPKRGLSSVYGLSDEFTGFGQPVVTIQRNTHQLKRFYNNQTPAHCPRQDGGGLRAHYKLRLQKVQAVGTSWQIGIQQKAGEYP